MIKIHYPKTVEIRPVIKVICMIYQ